MFAFWHYSSAMCPVWDVQFLRSGVPILDLILDSSGMSHLSFLILESRIYCLRGFTDANFRTWDASFNKGGLLLLRSILVVP